MIHLFNPPKICIGIVFSFPLGHLHVPGELAYNDYAKFGGGKRGVLWDCASSECRLHFSQQPGGHPDIL